MRKRGLKILIAIVLCLTCFMTSSTMYAMERKNVKVAFFPMEGYHIVNENGTYSGMDVDYLKAISNYVAWDIEYVMCDSWEDALEKLANKEVDLVGSAQHSAERAEIYDYADLSSGYTFGVIATNAESDTAHEDFQVMKNFKFGMVHNYVRRAEFLDYLAQNGIDTPNIIEYESTAALHEALDTGEVDAFVHTFTEVHEGQRLIGRFSPRPFYYITYKGNEELIQELNHAIVDVNINQPALETELMNKYYYDKFDKSILLTTEEKAYLEEKGTLKVGCLDNYYPFSYVEEDEFKGLTIEVLEQNLAVTGVNLEYVLISNEQEARAALENGEIDIFAYSTDSSEVLSQHGLKAVCDYARVPLVLVMKNDKSSEEIQTLATVKFLEERVQEGILEQEVQVLTFNNRKECIDAVMSGDVDAVLCSGYYAEQLMRRDLKYSALQIESVLDEEYSVSISLNNNQTHLESILEKTIITIDSKMINEYLLRESTYPLVSIMNYIKTNSVAIIGYLILFMGVIIFVVVRMLVDSRKIQKLMYKDTKMDIWNLNYFTYWGEKHLANDKRGKYAVVYLNLSQFRRFNVVYGWNAGENLLESFADVLLSFVHAETEICARNQGDRFVMLLNYREEEEFFERLSGLKDRVENRLRKETGDFMKLQLGIYFIPNREVDLRLAVSYANQALEFITDSNTSGIEIYNEFLQNMIRERHDREKLLESVDIQKDFVAFYQPKVDIRNGQIVGAEALVRFVDPYDEGKIKSPYFFVPYYEQTGKITKLDMFMLETVCKLLRRRMDAELPIVPISCNFSRMHFMKPGFADSYEEILDKYNIPKELVEVEVTETLIMEEMDQQMVKENFADLKKRGIHLSIDDFGAGYSSLGVFEHIPATVVKMDRSFFLNKDNPERQVKIMRGIVTLSEELDAQVVCEGVETQKDVNLMEEIGAFIAQGYFYSKPIPEHEFEVCLEKGNMRQ